MELYAIVDEKGKPAKIIEDIDMGRSIFDTYLIFETEKDAKEWLNETIEGGKKKLIV